MMIKRIKNMEELDQYLHENTVVHLLKHSTRCSISTAALKEFQQMHQNDEEGIFLLIYVVEDRSISLKIADKFSIQHQSPQYLLFEKGLVSRHVSHHAIKYEELKLK